MSDIDIGYEIRLTDSESEETLFESNYESISKTTKNGINIVFKYHSVIDI